MYASIYRYCEQPIFADLSESQLPASKMSKRVQWLDDGAGLLVVSRTLWYNTVPGTKAALIIIDKMSHDNHG
jgi:hypothetical protein